MDRMIDKASSSSSLSNGNSSGVSSLTYVSTSSNINGQGAKGYNSTGNKNHISKETVSNGTSYGSIGKC